MSESIEEKARALRLRSHNHFSRKDFSQALNDNLTALDLLGVKLNPSSTRQDADTMFEQVKNEILAVGFDNILCIPRATNPRVDLMMQLLNDAGARLPFRKCCLLIKTRDKCLLECWAWVCRYYRTYCKLFWSPWLLRDADFLHIDHSGGIKVCVNLSYGTIHRLTHQFKVWYVPRDSSWLLLGIGR